MATKKLITSVDLLLDGIEKKELEEALGSYTKTQIPNAKNPFAKEQMRLKNAQSPQPVTKKTGSGIGSFVKNQLLATSDPYAKEKIVPHLTNTSLMQSFGTLSPEQQDAMNKHAAAFNTALKTTQWTQVFYGGILNHYEVSLSTFLHNPSMVVATEDFYTNYNISKHSLLTEDAATPAAEIKAKRISSNERAGMAFIQSSTGIQAYVKTVGSATFYIGRAKAGKYLAFTQSRANVLCDEAVKLMAFSNSHFDEAKQRIIPYVSKFFKTPQEQAFLEAMTKEILPQVVKDSFTFGLVDVLNLGMTQGHSHQAGTQLKNNQLVIQSGEYGDSLVASNPEAANEIIEKLNHVYEYKNPYISNLDKLKEANRKSQNLDKQWNSITNVAFNIFGNLISKIQNACGASTSDGYAKVLLAATPIDKANALVSAYRNHTIYIQNNDACDIFNPIVQINFMHKLKGKPAYAFWPKFISGCSFIESREQDPILKIPHVLYTTGKKSSVAEVRNWKGFVFPEAEHHYIMQEAERNADGKTVSTAAYLETYRSLDSKSETSQNNLVGAYTSTGELYLDVLGSLYNDGEGTFKSDRVLFGLVPRILFEGYQIGLWSNHKQVIPEHPPATWYSFLGTIRSSEVDDIDEKKSWVSRMVSFETILRDFLSVVYNINSNESDIIRLRDQFTILVQNLQNGYWTINQNDFIKVNNVPGETRETSDIADIMSSSQIINLGDGTSRVINTCGVGVLNCLQQGHKKGELTLNKKILLSSSSYTEEFSKLIAAHQAAFSKKKI